MNRPWPAVAAVAFDLDGTLVDSAPDIQHALNAALTEAGLKAFPLDSVRGWIGDGPDVLIARALAAQGVEGDAALRSRLRASFDRVTLSAPLQHGHVFAGIRSLLEVVHGRLPLAVVSNKPTPLSRAVLHSAGLLDFFDHVHGADTAALRKPAPTLLLAAAAAMGAEPRGVLMVGDSVLDMRSAHAAGCPAALVGWGYGGHAVEPDANIWRIGAPHELHAVLVPSALDAQPETR